MIGVWCTMNCFCHAKLQNLHFINKFILIFDDSKSQLPANCFRIPLLLNLVQNLFRTEFS